MRYGSDQVQGRHPYLVTGAAVLRRAFHAPKSQDKGV